MVVKLIRLYQLTLSPDHSWVRIFYPAGYCPYHPTCSQYAIEAVQAKGVVLGLWLAMKRIWRCRPGVEPTYDPLKTV